MNTVLEPNTDHHLCPKCLVSFRVRNGREYNKNRDFQCKCRIVDKYVFDQHVSVCNGKRY